MKSELELCQDVLEALDWEPAVNACLIEVTVLRDRVNLSGVADCEDSRLAAVRAVRRVRGVAAVDCQMVLVAGADSMHEAVQWRPEAALLELAKGPHPQLRS
jgi:hypothetical protein